MKPAKKRERIFQLPAVQNEFSELLKLMKQNRSEEILFNQKDKLLETCLQQLRTNTELKEYYNRLPGSTFNNVLRHIVDELEAVRHGLQSKT
jgi:hypothetical protein